MMRRRRKYTNPPTSKIQFRKQQQHRRVHTLENEIQAHTEATKRRRERRSNQRDCTRTFYCLHSDQDHRGVMTVSSPDNPNIFLGE